VACRDSAQAGPNWLCFALLPLVAQAPSLELGLFRILRPQEGRPSRRPPRIGFVWRPCPRVRGGATPNWVCSYKLPADYRPPATVFWLSRCLSVIRYFHHTKTVLDARVLTQKGRMPQKFPVWDPPSPAGMKEPLRRVPGIPARYRRPARLGRGAADGRARTGHARGGRAGEIYRSPPARGQVWANSMVSRGDALAGATTTQSLYDLPARLSCYW
jgi:hypothetical protein